MNLRILILALIILPSYVARAEQFNYEEVSCLDKSKQDFQEKVYIRSMGIANAMPGIDISERLAIALDGSKKLANQGNGMGMQFYWALIFTGIVRSEFKLREQLPKIWIVPDKYRDDMIEAMTYLYISEFAENDRPEFSRKSIKKIENENSGLQPEWIEQAKANAQAWKKHCGF